MLLCKLQKHVTMLDYSCYCKTFNYVLVRNLLFTNWY